MKMITTDKSFIHILVFVLTVLIPIDANAWWSSNVPESTTKIENTTHYRVTKLALDNTIVNPNFSNNFSTFVKDHYTSIIEYTTTKQFDTDAHSGDQDRNGGDITYWFAQFISDYNYGNYQSASHSLSKCIHLIEDMGVPAHAYNIKHALTNGDYSPLGDKLEYLADFIYMDTISNLPQYGEQGVVFPNDPITYYSLSKSSTLDNAIDLMSATGLDLWKTGSGAQWCGDANPPLNKLPCADGTRGSYDSDDWLFSNLSTTVQGSFIAGQIKSSIDYVVRFLLAVDRQSTSASNPAAITPSIIMQNLPQNPVSGSYTFNITTRGIVSQLEFSASAGSSSLNLGATTSPVSTSADGTQKTWSFSINTLAQNWGMTGDQSVTLNIVARNEEDLAYYSVNNTSGTNISANTAYSFTVNNYIAVACTLPGNFSLTSPSNSATGVSTTPILDWTDASGAISYDIQVCADSSCASVIKSQTITSSQWTVLSALNNASIYYWRVRANNTCGSNLWSSTRSFTTTSGTCTTTPGTPTLSLPSDGFTGLSGTPTFNWIGISGAASYDFQICTDASCISVVKNQNVAGIQWTVTPALNLNAQYYWRVRANNACSQPGSWSAIWSFWTKSDCTTPGAPTLSTPAVGSTGVSVSPVFMWSNASGADSYRIDLYQGSSCTLQIYGFTTVTSPYSNNSDFPLALGQEYCWRIGAVNGCETTWSPLQHFTTVCPTLLTAAQLSPSNGATGVSTSPTLDWDDVSGVSSYDVQVCTDSGCGIITRAQEVVSSQWTVSLGLVPNTLYWWRFRVHNSCGVGSWSPIWSFDTNDTQAPTGVDLTINNGDLSTNNQHVLLSLSATDNIGIVGYYISESPINPLSSSFGWQSITSSKNYWETISYGLSIGNGTKTVYVWYKDSAGNISSSINSSITLSANVPSWPAEIPQTGQTTCYSDSGSVIPCSGTGQDGEFQAGVAWPNPRFTPMSSSTGTVVTDNLTGLIWPQDGSTPTVGSCTGGALTWQAALDYVSCLNTNNYLGHNDWRLPNVNELLSLVNYSQASQMTPIIMWLNAQGFKNVNAFFYWSATTYTNFATTARFVHMLDGAAWYTEKTDHGNVWPVRAGLCGSFGISASCLPKTGQMTVYSPGDDGSLQTGIVWPTPRFTVVSSASGTTVTDALTGLIWPQDGSTPTVGSCTGGVMTWQAALDYVACLNANNYLAHNNWRLPNVNELKSLTNYGQPNIASWLNDQEFVNAQTGRYWSSTSTSGFFDFRWLVSMGDGVVFSSSSYDSGAVWPVRTAQSISNTSISAPALTYGENGMVTVTISSAYSAPTGIVSLSVDGGAATSHMLYATTSTTSTASFALGWPAVGSHSVSAIYTAKGNFTASSASGSFTVSPRPLTITAAANIKITGASDPIFTYQITNGSLASGDTITGSLTRVAGETTGTYAIQQGTLTAGDNYQITFIGANLTIANTLTLHAPMPTAVRGAATVAVGGKVYVIGGFDSGFNVSGIVQIYDTATDTWTAGASKSTPVFSANAAVINGKVYVVGGHSIESIAIDSLEIYDPAANTWSSGANLPIALSIAGVETVNGKLYVIGGLDSSYITFNSMYVYDPTTGGWSTLSPMNTARAGFGTGVFNGEIYAFGGNDDTGNRLNTTEVYDPSTDVWTLQASMQTARRYFRGAALDSLLYAFGGSGNAGILQDIAVYDPATNTWSADPKMLNSARNLMGTAVVGSRIFVMGGYDGTNVVNINESYDVAGCYYAFDRVSASYSSTGGSDSVIVTASGSQCSGEWTAVSNSSWITVTNGASATGNGTVSYSVAAYSGAAPQTGTITIAGLIFTVTQTQPGYVSLGNAVNNQSLTLTTGGNVNWFGQNATTNDGTAAAHSGVISDNQNTWMQTTVNGNGAGSFFWKVSSESGHDYLRFSIDGVEQAASISGEAGWTQVFYSITGECPHTLRWVYSKDGSGSTGSDSGWVDQVEWNPGVCSVFGLNQSNNAFDTAGGTGTINVTAGTGCGWTAVSNASWITITAGENGRSNGSVSYLVTANTGTATLPRTGTLTVAGKTYTVMENGTAPMLTLHAPMPTAVNAAATAAVGGKVYVIGGWNAVSGMIGIVQIYNTATDTWTRGASNPRPLLGATAVAINEKIYVVGGWYMFRENFLEIYDTVTDTWSSENNLPIAVSGAGVAALNGKLYVMGGMDSSNATLTVTYLYDPATGEWSSLSPMNTARAAFGTGVIDGKIYVFGGGDGTGNIINSTEVYDLSTDVWTSFASMQTARGDFGGAALGNLLYAFGGRGNTGELQDVEIYDLATNTWSTDPRILNTARASMGIAVVGSSIYIMGGFDWMNYSSVNESYDIAGCYYALDRVSATYNSTGGSDSVIVTASGSQCGSGWTAVSNSSWITVTSGASGIGNGTVSYSVAAYSGTARTGTIIVAGQTFTVTQAQPTLLATNVTLNSSSNTYGGNGSVTVTVSSASSAPSGNILLSVDGGSATTQMLSAATSTTMTATFTLTKPSAGSHTLIATYTAQNGFAESSATDTLTVIQRTLTVTVTGANKVYDGTTNAIVSYTDNRLSGDNFMVSGTATFANKNVGTDKTVTVTGLAITGADSGNYTLAATTTSASANITPKELSATGITIANKVYDGTTAATLNGTATVVGVISGDVVSLSGQNGIFNDKNAGNGKPVIMTVSLTGADSGNYSFTSPASLSANITPKNLMATASGVNKIYDGTTTASVTFSDNRVTGDVLTINGTAIFTTKNIGIGKTVSVSGITISGTDAGNYGMSTTTATVTANITARTLTVNATTLNKVYDATNAATVTFGDNRVAGDILTIGGIATFANKNIETGKSVSVTNISMTGTDAANYTLAATTASSTANITVKNIIITGMTAANKVYDGNVTATLSAGSLLGILSGDVVSCSGQTGAFANKNFGNAKVVTVTSITLSGADAGNYTVINPTDLSADITARSLTVTATAANRMYDSTTMVNVTYGDNRVTGDVLTVNGTANFADTKVGSAKVVSVANLTITGADATNYVLAATTANTTADIIAPDGDLDGNGASVTDALRALRIAGGLITATAADRSHGDVAPLINGVPQPDDSIDIGDVTVILRKSVGLVNWM